MTSSESKVREFYENSADWYSKMMDAEIDLPVYSDTLGRLAERIANIPGPVMTPRVDRGTCCRGITSVTTPHDRLLAPTYRRA